MTGTSYQGVPVRVYRKDRDKLQKIQLEQKTRLGRQVTLAEVVGQAVKLLEAHEQHRAEQELRS